MNSETHEKARKNCTEKGRHGFSAIFLDLILLTVMAGLLLLASLRSFFNPPELLVAWGENGTLPAVCYSSCSNPWSRRYTVLCPGGSSAALQLLFALDKRGCARLENIFSPAISPASRGVRVLLNKKACSSLILFTNKRRWEFSSELAAEAHSKGMAVWELLPSSNGETNRIQQWEFRSWREKNGDMHCNFYQLKEQVEIIISWQKNGVLRLQYQDPFANKTIKQFPRSNRCGTWQVCLDSR